ncbi:cyclic nucleotide-binding domain-containing protein [Prosthecobacter sp.]|uniref:cyclic nucleotide-binding domain-containing protein n=1 Tax=Prosthecobacter sp. TaxID=1965333 RepID=UPI001D7D4F31|nr:cyclic nucleotide-binding domain-containing protein [Prosthecobacter sp.]MCB1275401.1 cyclic nucleotide-binding domain-containing protein [Prosthecobacter sp.]
MKEFAYIHDEKHSPSPLRAVPALASFSDDQLDDVLNSSSLLQCEPGDHIIKEGSIDSRIYVLLSGELEVRVGSKKVASITRIGEVFGELALVNHDKRLASVIASTKAVCLAVDQKFLQDIHPREEDPDFHAALYEFVARLVVRKLEATSKRLADVERELRLAQEALAHAQAARVDSVKLKRPVKRAAPAPRTPVRVR